MRENVCAEYVFVSDGKIEFVRIACSSAIRFILIALLRTDGTAI